MGKIEIFTFSGYWKSFNVAIPKIKCLCSLKFSTRIATFLISPHQKNIFVNWLNAFEDIAFLLGQCNREKLKFLHFLDIGKVVTLLSRN